jgi:hypothetical protein
MIVKMPKNYETWMTVEKVAIAKKLIRYEKENDDCSVKEWAIYAICEALRDRDDYDIGAEGILTCSAEIGGNNRVWDAYFEGSKDLDIWIKATAKTGNGYTEIGAYLSDIWQTGATPYADHMYIAYYKRQ